MRSRRRRGGGVGSWHSEDGVHLGVPPTRYGAPPAAADGGGRLPRCQSSEDVSSGRRSSGDAASRCRRTQFRLRPLAPASSVGQLDQLQGGRPDRLQGGRPAAGAAAAAEPAAGGGDAQPWARGSAEERRRLFQRRRARWEPEPAARQAAAPGPGPTVERQDVTTAANCVGLSTKGGGEGLAKHPAGQNGAAPEPGGTVGVSVLLQSWMERLERLSLQQRREEMEGCTTAADGEAAGDLPSDPPSAPATPPTPTGDWVPTFVVSDCSGRSWPAPWSELLASGGGGGGRRLSAVSDCSTVSSAGWDRSRRGSLLDLDTQGLRLDDDGRLERAATHHGSETEPRDGPAATNGQLGTEIDLGTIPGPEDGLGTTSGLEDGLGTISGPGDGRRRSAETSRKISSWSYSSVSTLSQDEEEEPRTAGPTPGASSQWRKVKGVVQWTPFVQTYKKQKYLWVQLAGHQGNFRAGRDGTIQKRLCGREQQCLQELMDDSLRPFVPEYRGQTESEDGQQFLQLQDLLAGFVEPCVMDCKIGVRTYLEEELAKAKVNPKLRKDMYDKMMAVDKTAPTEEEHRLKAVTKPRYMVWRETISSTASLGFRIEGIRKSRGYSSKDFKTTRSEGQIRAAIAMFTDGYPDVVTQYLARLDEILAALHGSEFFRKHEFIGSSLLFVHDANRAGVWLIDFAKTTPLPAGARVSHRAPWRPGSHEDGYLTGAENLRRILAEMAGRGAAP